MTQRTYTVAQFIQAFNVSRSSLYRLWDSKEGPAFMRVGNRRLIPVDAAEAWVGRQTDQGHSQGATLEPQAT